MPGVVRTCVGSQSLRINRGLTAPADQSANDWESEDDFSFCGDRV